jgi:HEAT repeat protein
MTRRFLCRRSPSWLLIGIVFLAAISLVQASEPAGNKEAAVEMPHIDDASWIWGEAASDVCEFRTSFTLEQPPVAASVMITADNGYELYVNGGAVGFDVGASSAIWNSLEKFDIKSRLAQGRNVIGIRGICLGGSRGLVAAIRIDMPDGKRLELTTNDAWRVSSAGDPEEYSHPEYLEDDTWANALVLGKLGMAPWGKLTYSGSKGGRREGTLPVTVSLSEPDVEFVWPAAVAFLSDDCSVYTPLRGDAWGVCFRVNNWSRAYTEFDLPCPSKIGRKLCVMDPLGPEAQPRVLLDAGSGVIGSPSVSYDGRWIYVAMAREAESFFHIYRVPVEGGAPERMTEGPFHDIDPVELPDGRIVFTSTRAGTFEEYHNPPSRALFVMESDGSDIKPITFTPSFDNEPKIMSDGRIVFVRTDNFFDRAKVETQLHSIHPDGTNGLTEVGADVGADYGVRLRVLGYGSPTPLPEGRLAFISSRGNFVCSPGTAEPSFQPLPGGLGDLAALPDGRLLATVLRPKLTRMVSDVLAVIDPQDDRVVTIYESSEGAIHSPVFVGPRPRPPQLADAMEADMTGHPHATGFLFCQDARFTRKHKAGWGHVRAIRVLAAKPLTVRSSHSHIVHAGHETVELGTVPLAADGSFSIEVPADVPLSLQAVDAEGRSELNEMSWIYVRPGERRSCIGCHHPRDVAPGQHVTVPQAASAEPLMLLGQGNPHHFRGNNPGVTGMMDLQFERFRETASLNLLSDDQPSRTGREEVVALIDELQNEDSDRRISAAQRLALLRDRRAAESLAVQLSKGSVEERVAIAMALAACGQRESVPALLEALKSRKPLVAQAASIALENLTGHAEPFQAFGPLDRRSTQADAWQAWLATSSWEEIEQRLIREVGSDDPVTQRRAIVALGHIGGDAAQTALRAYVRREKDNNPYPRFENNNRTDRFTFSAESPLNPRTLQEAVRAIGYLQDEHAVELLRDILAEHTDPQTGNLFLAEAAIDALGRIATSEAEATLIRTFDQLQDYVQYVGWYSDHPALYACHASPLHARIIAALHAFGSTQAGPIVADMIRSVPTDPDRALFPESDTYEMLVGRVIRRSGRGDEVVRTCLAILGDPQAEASADIQESLGAAFAAWAGAPGPENRAAQILSAVCRDAQYEPRVRAAYERYRALPDEPVERPLGNPSWIPLKHWVLFYLGRTLGNLRDLRSVDTLMASLDPEWNEARHGRPDPAEPNIHFLQLEYTPCWRATAAWALGQIGDRRAVPLLLDVVANLDNATDTRHTAAEALGAIGDPGSQQAMEDLAESYPEQSTRRVLLEACQ